MTMLMAFTIVTLLILIVVAVVVAPWLGWKLALQYTYRRFCAYAADPACDELCAWDTAFGEAHEQNAGDVWRQLLLPEPQPTWVNDFEDADPAPAPAPRRP